MSKAGLWTSRNVAASAQDVARKAARQDGKSLGEWLHDSISDRSNEFVRPNSRPMNQRDSAVEAGQRHTSGVGLSAPSRSTDRSDVGDETDRRRERLISRRPRRDAMRTEDVDTFLDDAIASIERGAFQGQRRTDEVLAAVASLMKDTESRRDAERDAVGSLSRKLSNLETTLNQRLEESENSPIKGALARLEARLETIGKRNAAESTITPKLSTQGADLENDAPLRRLEEKLNTLLDAVRPRPAEANSETSLLAIKTDQGALPQNARRSLSDAISDIVKHQRRLDDPAQPLRDRSLSEARSQPIISHGSNNRDFASPSDLARDSEREHRSGGRENRGARQPRPHIGTTVSRNEKAASLWRSTGEQAPLDPNSVDRHNTFDAGVSTKQNGGTAQTHGEYLAEGRVRDPGRDTLLADRLEDGMRELRALIATLAEQPRERTRGDVSVAADHASNQALGKIEQRIGALTSKVDQALARGPVAGRGPTGPSVDTSALEESIRDLGEKIQVVRAPSADASALEALQLQVERLSGRLDRSQQNLSALPALATSVQELFDQLQTTRDSIETSAAHAAREVLRIAATDGRNRRAAPTSQSALDAIQENSDLQIKTAPKSAHGIVGDVVDRLPVTETDRPEVQQRPSMPTAAPATTAKKVSESLSVKDATARLVGNIALSNRDAVREPHFSAPSSPRAPSLLQGARDYGVGPTNEVQRGDFIAAARRAAKSAQTEPTFAAQRPSMAIDSALDTRSGLLAKARDYVSTHKRPVLLGVAAIFVVLGTLVVLQHTRLGDNQDFAATDIHNSSPAEALAAKPVKQNVAGLASGDLSPNVLPKAAAPLANAIAGSDPVQTGSLPRIPSFAALAAPSAVPPLPPGLKAAADAGNGAAEYELGARFAEGRAVPRDLRLAVQFLTKAADQGMPPAQYRLASMYEKGLGVSQDKVRAKRLYAQAAEAGNARAMHNLAVILADGDGHPDYANAATWFRKAASYGVHDSQFNLAILLARGLGVPQSLVQSYQWFAVAAVQNDADAAQKRDEIGTKLTANDLAIAKALAAAFQPKTAAPSANTVEAPSAGWESLSGASPAFSVKAKISSL